MISEFGLSRDGTRLVTVTSDYAARVLDLRANDPSVSAEVLPAHEKTVEAAALSADGSTLVTASKDTARVWDLEAKNPSDSVNELREPQIKILALALSTDGKRLVTASDDGTLRVWLLRIEDLLTVAVDVAGRKLSAEERKAYGLEE